MSNKSHPTAAVPAVSRQQRRAAARARARARRQSISPGALSAGAALALGLGLSPSDAHAAGFVVTNLNDSGVGSLRQAIADANAAAGADVITFQTGLTGTITLTSGQLAISDSLTITGPGASVVSVSGNNASRVLYLYNGSAEIDVVISGLTITGGGNVPVGGGIVNFGENLALDGVTITANAATNSGAGIWGGGGNKNGMDLTIRNSVISGNVATQNGGGIYVYLTSAPLLIQDTQITGNHAGRDGGGIFLYDPNHAVTVERSTISGNTATNHGGGVFLYDIKGSDALTIRATTISGNSAVAGGGVHLFNANAAVVVESSTISGNQATAGNGGGLYMASTTPPVAIRHSTIAANSASGTGGGVHVRQGMLNLSHTIIADNSAATDFDVAESNGGQVTADHGLIESPGTATITDGGGNLASQDPQLGALQNNGGTTQTQLPAATSPVINAGDAAFVAPPTLDQRGSQRVFGGVIDIGAVERNPGTLQCTAADVSALESVGNVTITVTRTGGVDGAIAVSYATANGTAIAPGDFTDTSGMLQWSDQEAASKIFQVPIINDALVESSETFTANLSSATAGAALGAVATATVTISDDDAAPTISTIADQVIAEDEATAAIAFTIGDADNPDALVVSATSSNHALVPDASVVLGGTGASRTVTVTPLANHNGSTDVTISVTDGVHVTTEMFAVAVTASNDAPTISVIADQTIAENAATDAIAFTVDDVDNAAADLVVSATSSNPTLLPNANIVLEGIGASRTVTVTPLANQSGSADVTISVTDGANVTTEMFAVAVTAASVPDAATSGDAGIVPDAATLADAGASAGAGGASGAGGKGGAGGTGGKSGTGGTTTEDASTLSDAGGQAGDGGVAKGGNSKSGCGCSVVGDNPAPSKPLIASLVGLAGFASRRRRRRFASR